MGKVEELYDASKKEYDAVLKELEPLRVKQATAVAKVQAAEAELKAINVEIKKLKFPRLADAKALVARLAPKGLRLGASEAPAETEG